MTFDVNELSADDYKSLVGTLEATKVSLEGMQEHLSQGRIPTSEHLGQVIKFYEELGEPIASLEDGTQISMEAINSMLDRVKRALNKTYEKVFKNRERFFVGDAPERIKSRVAKLKPRIEAIKGSPKGKITDEVVFKRLCIDGKLDYNIAALFSGYSDLARPYTGSYVTKGQGVRKEIGEIIKRLNNAAMDKTLKEDVIRMEFQQFCQKFTAPTASLNDKDLNRVLPGEERFFDPNPVDISKVNADVREALAKFAAKQHRRARWTDTPRNRLKIRDYRALAPKEMLLLLDVALKLEDHAKALDKEFAHICDIVDNGPCGYAQAASYMRPAINFGADGLSGYYLGCLDDIYHFTADDMISPVNKLCTLCAAYAKSIVDLVEESLFLYKD